jgi:glycosyltransferase involved in cell wall biosynthesis
VGIPVYNGENYIAEALASLEAQDCADFEVIIGDNGSTDGTCAICERFAEEHPWVTYLRSDTNRGAAWNFNRLVEPSRGEYFMWMAHDDLLAPSLIRKAAQVLDDRPGAVLCSAGVQAIDGQGVPIRPWTVSGPRWSRSPAIRFGDAIRDPLYHYSFAMIRRSTLMTTRLFGNFLAADGVLLAELALRGNFAEILEPLFFNRMHPQRSTRANTSALERLAWYDPEFHGRVAFPGWRLLKEYFRAIQLAPIDSVSKGRATMELLGWSITSIEWLGGDLLRAPKQLLSRG